MAYEMGCCYHIVNMGAKLRLNRYGSGNISNHQNVTLWAEDTAWDQVWKLQPEVNGASLRSALNLAYGLNIWMGNTNKYNCDVYPVAGNEHDACVDLQTVDREKNLYRIKMANYDLFLTAGGKQNGANVSWTAYSGTDVQLWRFDKTACPTPPDPENIVDAAMLKELCLQYTDFTMSGQKIQLPYRWAGKLTPAQIRTNLTALVNNNPDESPQTLATGHIKECGVDCSGLVYYCLNEAANGTVRTFFEAKLNLPGTLSYAYGISAAHMTNSAYGTVITCANDVKPGDVIRFDNGGHIGVIYEVEKAGSTVCRILYAHSSGDKGPHKGIITVAAPDADINDARQTWKDWDELYAPHLKSLYNYVLRYSL